jgi:SAM-dependent methyltransferase
MAMTSWPRLRSLIERAGRRAHDTATGPEVALSGHTPRRSKHNEPHPVVATAAEESRPQALRGSDFARALQAARLHIEHDVVSSVLYRRLDENDVMRIERRIGEVPELNDHYARAATPAVRRFLALSFGLWLNVAEISEKTGLNARQPPEEVHAMARGPLAAAGGLYEADLIVDALASADIDVRNFTRGLDFGCSSGRVVRVLAAAYPSIRWSACDPNEPAINWAAQNLPGIKFFVNGQAPPLPLAGGELDVAYAISVWSHFSPELGIRWFEEMRRLLRPQGCLVITTHGLTSIAYYAAHELRTPEQSREITDALYHKGWWYAREFGEVGDWGVVNPDWGTAFLSPEWLLTQLCPRWRVLEFVPGRNQHNQDVYVLQRT